MQMTLNLLNSSSVVYNYQIQDFKQGENFSYVKIKVELINTTFLHIKIYTSDQEYIYSFHWHDRSNNLIVRWDNAPHHPYISTFPHHKHIGEQVEESFEITVADVIDYIRKELR